MKIERKIKKILVANRGEIAVRVIRAAYDSGIVPVAVYATSDSNSLHVRLAQEAYSLEDDTASGSYLDMNKILDIARKSGVDAVHPGYGFLAENAQFAKKVVEAGFIWVGPGVEAILALGDKISARKIAQKVQAPLVVGSDSPVKSCEEVVAFAKEHGLPVAIKAAYGGGGRGLKIARELSEISELYESAVREAEVAFGRGECFVEKFLDGPRHVETQCLADEYGNVVVVSTRDCSLQRRNQKLVEEAPAPFLSEQQRDAICVASKNILAEVGYVGAGTCEFLLSKSGEISFLEVNTRLQVEHTVSEEISGIDLVREQFRIAEGQVLGYGDPVTVGHSIEFRINGEDAGRNFMPQAGTVKTFRLPTGPGVRVDVGVEAGDNVSGVFDSLLAKVIVTGSSRVQALERARRVFREIEITGVPTVIPFHKAVLDDVAFAPVDPLEPFLVHTRWIETEFVNTIKAYNVHEINGVEVLERQHVVVEVGGKRLDVVLPASLFKVTDAVAHAAGGIAKRPKRSRKAEVKAKGDELVCPMQGTIVKVAVENGGSVVVGDLVVVLEAMKMEQPLFAHKAGEVQNLRVQVGDVVSVGEVVVSIV